MVNQSGNENGDWILRCSCATRCGERENNEDNFRFSRIIEVTDPVGALHAEASVWLDQTHVFCVCDGIHGAAGGELAARQALIALSRFLQHSETMMPPKDLAVSAAEAAHSAVLEMYRNMGLSGGCTMVMAVLQGSRYTVINIGDSPAFHYSASSRRLTELSVRHSLHWLSGTRGKPCPAGQGHRLAYYLGREGAMAQDMLHITDGTLDDGDGLLLCSDGVTNGIPQARLKKYLRQKRSAAYLVEKASGFPDADNCTAICLYARELK